MLEDGIAELVADCLRMRIEEARQHGSIVCPGMHLEREVVAHHGNLVGTGRLFHERGSARAIGTFEVLEITIATEAPLGGRRIAALSCAAASAAIKRTARKPSFLFISELDAGDPGCC